MNSKEFNKALELLEKKGISKDYMYDAMVLALTSSYKKNYGLSNGRVEVNKDTGEFKVFSFRTVVLDKEHKVSLDEDAFAELEEEERLEKENQEKLEVFDNKSSEDVIEEFKSDLNETFNSSKNGNNNSKTFNDILNENSKEINKDIKDVDAPVNIDNSITDDQYFDDFFNEE